MAAGGHVSSALPGSGGSLRVPQHPWAFRGMPGRILGRRAQPGADSPLFALPCAARPVFCYRLLTPAGCGTNERGGAAWPGLAWHGVRGSREMGDCRQVLGLPRPCCVRLRAPFPHSCRGKPTECPALEGACGHTWWLWPARPSDGP